MEMNYPVYKNVLVDANSSFRGAVRAEDEGVEFLFTEFHVIK